MNEPDELDERSFDANSLMMPESPLLRCSCAVRLDVTPRSAVSVSVASSEASLVDRSSVVQNGGDIGKERSLLPRPKQIPKRTPLTAAQIQTASYVGSAEHKIEQFWGGLPQAKLGKDGKATRPKKQLTTICYRTTLEERDQASDWVRLALTSGQWRYFEGDKTFPKHIWYQDDEGQFWFGFAINQIAGTYKGWPITEAEKREKFD